MADYGVADLKAALAATGIARGDTVYCHSNIGLFGACDGVTTREALCEAFFDAVMTAIGPTGTLIVPTYTYSFCNGLPFDPAATASKMGIFAESVRRHPDALRSIDPLHSVAVIGQNPGRFCIDLPPNSFAEDSTFGRFHRENGIILCLNHPGCTHLHYVERSLEVLYRFDKTFHGDLILPESTHHLGWDMFVRYLSDDLLAHDPWPFVRAVKANGSARWCGLGRGEVLTIRAESVMRTVADALPDNPWFLTLAQSAERTPLLDTSRR